MEKPVLILVAATIRANSGSEPGKGWIWANALSKFYRLEILSFPDYARELEKTGLPPNSRIHIVEPEVHSSLFAFYTQYPRWCRHVIPACWKIMQTQPVVGLHHVTIGSFRALPRYDQLGIPYTVGPLGGGESIPWSLLPEMRLPMKKIITEAMRQPINHAFPLVPGLRTVLSGARLALATTSETGSLLTKMGARRVAVVFPDAIDTGSDDDAEVLRLRERQAVALAARFRCVCAGRALWWKGIHLAIDFVHLLRSRGVNVSLDIYSQGEDLPALRERAARLGIGDHTVFHEMVTRDELMKAYRDCHLFVNPTMHDSASSALLEAYATGLPSMTLGLGGAVTVTTPQTGLNARVRRIEDWLEDGARMVTGWIADPPRWLDACRAAKARSHDFGRGYPEARVREYLEPIFSAPAPSSPAA